MLLSHMNHQFAAGVNQIVYHGWSHKAPKLATSWPGWGGFSYGVSDDYGPENPTWGSGDDKHINEYVGRAQTILRTGTQRSDVAIYHEGKGHSAAGQTADRYVADLTLEHAGYRYGFMNKTLATSPNGRRPRRAPGPRRRAVQGLRRRQHRQRQQLHRHDGSGLGAAHGAWADAGLPIVFVGPPPTRTLGNHPDQDAELNAIIARLLTKPNVSQVATQADLPGALRAAGVKPATDFSAPSNLISTRRETDDTNYYFFYNEGAPRANTDVTLTGNGIPYQLDAWTGKITPIAAYERTADGVKLTLSVASGDATIVAVTAGNDFAKPKQQRVSASATTRRRRPLRSRAGDIAIRRVRAGRVHARRSATAVPWSPRSRRCPRR